MLLVRLVYREEKLDVSTPLDDGFLNQDKVRESLERLKPGCRLSSDLAMAK